MRPPEPSSSGTPARSTIGAYLEKQLDALKGRKTQRDIARELGYTNPNIISMFKAGETKVPLEKIPALAKALHVDPGHLFRIAMEQYWPKLQATISEIFGRIASANEEELFLTAWRQATGGSDPAPTEKLKALFNRMINEAGRES
jgi:transcriptional regulator with XRE-family HTH domain